mmetsp:Transcript_47007/g.56843  ORF Transcript_47007/g.56843 Transcript_47007/m.56843 type:complete len:749 (-) Transcript_47007:160-2406(-)
MTNEPIPPPGAAAEQDHNDTDPSSSSSRIATASKLLIAATFLLSAARSYTHRQIASLSPLPRRRLDVATGTPSFVKPLLDELTTRVKLFADTPPEEVKYWFEYTGPLQKYYYRYSKSRGKADYFEGRDDSGVISARLVEDVGGGGDFAPFFTPESNSIPSEAPFRTRLVDNCLHMGSPARPATGDGSFWAEWFGSSAGAMDRCRVLFVLNTVGAGKGSTILWETPPPLPHEAGPQPWQSEQETAAMHLERNLREIDAMCATGQIAARVQVLVCEPIPGVWTDWMDGLLVNCGGKKAPLEDLAEGKDDVESAVAAAEGNPYDGGIEVEDRASPVQVVVVASAKTADTCHDLKSGFMEQRMQDLILAPPFLGENGGGSKEQVDAGVKTTHPDLISSDDHDVYVALKWSTLVTTRTISAFLQASADLAAASKASADPNKDTKPRTKVPTSQFLIPSFVRVSYVSEENNKVAKWRMHGDFFHPAAWEICKDSYEMTFIPHSLSSHSGVTPTCPKVLEKDDHCGQWWAFFTEEQMPTAPEVYANENTVPLIWGGSNFFWMLTERQRKEIVTSQVCEHNKKKNKTNKDKCGDEPQAVIPLGDLESFLVNYMPNTALGKKHEKDRRPGYSQGDQLEKDREKVRERKQLKGQEEIEKALFDYTVYPAALFHKDATIKAARDQDAVIAGKASGNGAPQKIKSSYYDVTITKPRDPIPSWCQHLARRGLCALYADYLREGTEKRCLEACGLKLGWSEI